MTLQTRCQAVGWKCRAHQWLCKMYGSGLSVQWEIAPVDLFNTSTTTTTEQKERLMFIFLKRQVCLEIQAPHSIEIFGFRKAEVRTKLVRRTDCMYVNSFPGKSLLCSFFIRWVQEGACKLIVTWPSGIHPADERSYLSLRVSSPPLLFTSLSLIPQSLPSHRTRTLSLPTISRVSNNSPLKRPRTILCLGNVLVTITIPAKNRHCRLMNLHRKSTEKLAQS